ncbi:MAG: hypothetical protein JNL01_13195 [Bdellovibrionales bacterium]|nr:hypothetical protein [Bdellovibrionales bacterium]
MWTIALALLATSALADEPSGSNAMAKNYGDRGFERISVRAAWVDYSANEKLNRVEWPTESFWVWKPKDLVFPAPHPIVRTYIKVPAQYKTAIVKDDEGRSAQSLEDQNQELVFELPSPSHRVTVELTEANGKKMIQDIQFDITLREAYTFVHESCQKLGIELIKLESQAPHYLVSVHCKNTADGIQMTAIKGPNLDWGEETFADHVDDGTDYWVYRLPPWQPHLSALGTFEVIKPETQARTIYEVVHRDPRTRDPVYKSWRAAVDIVSEYFSYSQNDAALTYSSFGLAMRAQASYFPWKFPFETSVSASATTIPISTSLDPDFTGSPLRIYSGHLRVGYTDRSSVDEWLPEAYVGWSGQGAWTRGSLFGPPFLGGFCAGGGITRRNPISGDRLRFWGRMSLRSPVGLGLDFSNLEFAGGVGWEISRIKFMNQERPLWVVGEVASTSWTDPLTTDPVYAVGLTQIWVGLSSSL